MTILLVNDDGYDREGIRTLENVLTEAGHEVWVCAPSSNRSGFSHAMTTSGSVMMTEYGKNHFHCSGTPVDCILYSLKAEIFPHRPDLVISGINHGYNCSSDIIYSGTCSAAREAVLQGIRGIALSCEPDEDGVYEFTRASRFVTSRLGNLIKLCTSDCFISLNFPPHFNEELRPASLGTISYCDIPEVIAREGKSFTLRLKPGVVTRNLAEKGIKSDLEVCQEGYIALSVIKVNPAVDEECHCRLAALLEP